MLPLSIATLLVFIAGKASGQCPLAGPERKVEGNVILTGLFPLRHGPDCTQRFSRGNSLLDAALWTLRRLSDAQFFPGQWKLGIDVWDSCHAQTESVKIAVRAMAESLKNEDPSCRAAVQAGLLVSNETPELVAKIAHTLGIPFLQLPQPDLDDHILAGIEVLSRLEKSAISVVASKTYQLTRFGDLAAEKGICIVNQFLFPSNRTSENYLRTFKRLQKSGTRTIVMIGNLENAKKLLEAAQKETNFHFDWVFIGINELKAEEFSEFPTAAPGLVAIYAENGKLPAIAAVPAEVPLDTEAAETHEILTNIRAIYSLSSEIKEFLKEKCSDAVKPCHFRDFEPTGKGADMAEMDTVLNTEISKRRIVIAAVSEAVVLNKVGFADATTTEVDVATIKSYHNETDLSTHSECSNCLCTNMDRSFLDNLGLKNEIWVYVTVTIASVGVIVLIAIAVYISVRVWNKDNTEGSQGFTIFMLISLIFLYIAVVPYVLNTSELTCLIRTPSTVLSYALIFSFLAARSIMLSSTAKSETSGHISGYVQTLLFFLMFGVQVALTTTDLIYNNRTYSLKVVTDNGPKIMCRAEWFQMTIAYSYVLALLLLLAITTPFATCSKRNYSEGPSFCIASYFTVLTWGGWISGYFLLEPQWNDFFLAVGITTTATLLLLIIFIPKTYMMATSAAADAVSVTLRQSNFERSPRPIYETIQVPTIPSHYGPEPTRSSYTNYGDPSSPRSVHSQKKAEF